MSSSVAFSTTRATIIARSSSAAKRFGKSSTTVATRAIVSDTVKGEHAEQYAELASLLENYQYSYKVGDKVHGKVVACDQKGALVEIGAKADALVPTSECSLSAVKNVRVRDVCDVRCCSRCLCVRVYRVSRRRRHSAFAVDDARPMDSRRRGVKPCVIRVLLLLARVVLTALLCFTAHRLRLCLTLMKRMSLKLFKTTTAKAC